ncbi:hypothetical protein FKG94_05285 [Exilibacterium tricleocarpae]|uniref:Flagellar hook-length control protein FliK n=1 Tax=Exilibacterium tricleocarpae TaxID=2591008 RepID=A0A545U3N4_9GAMM|nr:hypothetical protein [Exilibacterium tricleocarpae]TQV84081.1 hypothetical protein FKG94_05285 [Exilibacterium tricleocarpae]
MTVGETKRTTEFTKKDSGDKAAETAGVRRLDALTFSQEFHSVAGMSPQFIVPAGALSNDSGELDLKFSYNPSSAAGFPAPRTAEEPATTLLCNTILQKMLRDPALQDMAFSIQNKHGRVNVEAALSSGHMRCTLSTSNEKLRRRLSDARQQIVSSLGKNLRRQIDVEIKE